MIKFELVWIDKFIRWLLVSGLNGFMSCESTQTSWFQVWFNLKKCSSIGWNLSYIWKSEWAMILAMFEWPNLIGSVWNLVWLMVQDVVQISSELDKRCFGFGVDLVSYSAAVFSI